MNDSAGQANDASKDWLPSERMPWVRYRTPVGLLDQREEDPEVLAPRQAMIEQPQIKDLAAELNAWPGHPLKRHNDAKHLTPKLSTLAGFGLQASDPSISTVTEQVLPHQAAEGAFEIVTIVPKSYM